MAYKRKKPKSIQYIVKRLRELKALRYWRITGSRDTLRLRPPKSHKPWAEKFRKAIHDWLKVEGVMDMKAKVLLLFDQ